MNKICVTGCLGYIGSKLTHSLLKLPDVEVYGIDNCFWGNQSLRVLDSLQIYKNFEFIKCEAVDAHSYEEYINKTDTIISLAALVGAPLCEKYPKKAVETNFTAVKNLVEHISKKQRLIFLNTNSGYGKSNIPCTEESPLNPVSLYGRTKVEAEKYILEHENSVSLRLATVFGLSYRMRLDLLVNYYIEQIADTGKLEVYEPNARRNYVDIDDVVRAIIYFSLLNKSDKGVYNIGDNFLNKTKLSMAYTIFNTLDLEPNIKIIEGSDGDKRDYLVSNDKIASTGFKFESDCEKTFNSIYNFCKITNKRFREPMRNY